MYQNRSQIVVDPKDLYRIQLYGGLECAKNHFGIPSLTTFSVGAVHRRIAKEKNDVNSTPGGWCEFPSFPKGRSRANVGAIHGIFIIGFHGLVVIICLSFLRLVFFKRYPGTKEPPTCFFKHDVSGWSQISWGPSSLHLLTGEFESLLTHPHGRSKSWYSRSLVSPLEFHRKKFALDWELLLWISYLSRKCHGGKVFSRSF